MTAARSSPSASLTLSSAEIPAADPAAWRAALAPLGAVDACFLPEYHAAYALRIAGSRPLLWHCEAGGEHFVYPFLLNAVVIHGKSTGYRDISGIYGYTGPLASSDSPTFLARAWQAFDDYCDRQSIIAEFVRFSPFNRNERFAHPGTEVTENRTLAVSSLPQTEEALLALLGAKTRNMLRKAGNAGLSARELELPRHLPAFRALYDDTMGRNKAPEFFHYDDSYWRHMLALGPGLRLFGVFSGDILVACAMSVSHGASGLYHLGASRPDYSRLGAGNLSLYVMSCGLMRAGVTFLNMTGGRTTAADDPLLLFKKNNATGTAPFYIGKRIINRDAYGHATRLWGEPPDPAKVIFWR